MCSEFVRPEGGTHCTHSHKESAFRVLPSRIGKQSGVRKHKHSSSSRLNVTHSLWDTLRGVGECAAVCALPVPTLRLVCLVSFCRM